MEYIKGKVQEINVEKIILEVNGFGYEIFIHEFEKIKAFEQIKIYIFEDLKFDKNSSIKKSFFGFLNKNNLNFFKFLINISGIGTKTAFSIISNDLEKVFLYLETSNKESLEKFKGITSKHADSMICEVRRFKKNKKSLSFLEEINRKNNLSKDYFDEQFLFLSLKDIGFDPEKINDAIKKIKEEKIQFTNMNDAFNNCIKEITSPEKNKKNSWDQKN